MDNHRDILGHAGENIQEDSWGHIQGHTCGYKHGQDTWRRHRFKKFMNINYLLEVLDYIHYSLVIIVTNIQDPQGSMTSSVIQGTWMIKLKEGLKREIQPSEIYT